MPAAVAVPLIVGAGSAAAQVYGAKKQADTAKQAAATQTQAGNQANQMYRQIYEDQSRRQQPFMQAGQNALGSLSQMGSAPRPMFNPSQPMGGFQQAPTMQKPGGGTVQMRGPDGRVRSVPQHLMQQALQAGGQVVG